MAPIAIEGSPGDSTVVTLSAKFPFNNFDHADLIGPGSHHENIRMADLTLEPDTMKPMGKDHGWHLGFLGLPVHDDIPILSL
jgi:hypothetical protein